MIISSNEELRLFSPSNAIDNIDSLIGFICSSENDFLKEKLGSELYDSLIEYYNSTIRENITDYISQIQSGLGSSAYARILYIAQKAVTFDALGRAVSVQALSINGSGVNVASADDYKAADSQTIADFKKACIKESHSAINELLQTLEGFARKSEIETDIQNDISEEQEITDLWKNSRYFYLTTSLLIPTALVLQEYYNIYESREKFIQLLPELHYIQEDIIVPIYGEDFIDFLVSCQSEGTSDKHSTRIIRYLRKIMVRYLETRLTKANDSKNVSAYDEAVKLTNRLNEYLQVHFNDFAEELFDAFKTTSLYVEPEPISQEKICFKNNSDDSVMFVSPGLL